MTNFEEVKTPEKGEIPLDASNYVSNEIRFGILTRLFINRKLSLEVFSDSVKAEIEKSIAFLNRR